MTKNEFLNGLREKLSCLPKEDVEERLAFYGEMIDDRIEEGVDEETAIAGLGSSDEIAAGIIADMPLTKIVKEKMKVKKQHSTIGLILISLGFPIWFSLLASAVAVAVALYASAWAVIISLWAAFASFAACAPYGIVAAAFLAVKGSIASGVYLLGCALMCAGLAIASFFGCRYITKMLLILTKKAVLGIKYMIVGRGKKK